MQGTELLNELLSLFEEQIPEADFDRAYPGSPGSRRIFRPAVTGEVEGETLKPGSEERRYRFRIFLPENCGADRAEEIFAAMCALAGERYPGFSAISRGAADRDKSTGLLTVACSLSFLTKTEGGSSAAGRKVALGGKEFLVTGVKTTVSRKGQELVSIGETVPFATQGEETEYTVELEGLDVSGLENLANFTASLENGPTYEGCRWKSLSDALRKGVFTAAVRITP